MARSLCRLLIYVNHDLVGVLYVTNMCFNAIRENQILAKISEFTVLIDTVSENELIVSIYVERKSCVFLILFCFTKVKQQDHKMSCADPDPDCQRADNFFYSSFFICCRGDIIQLPLRREVIGPASESGRPMMTQN